MTQTLFAISCALLAISLSNLFLLRKPGKFSELEYSVTVLLPMRDEQENVDGIIKSLAAQVGLPYLKFIVINDSSSDLTLQLASTAIEGDSRFTIVDSPPLRKGWLGKVNALQAGYELSESEILICVDSDVRLEPTALASSITLLEDLDLDFISPYPQQIANSWSERLIQPLLVWSWMTTVPLRLAEKFPRPAMAVANGQLFIMRKDALDAVGGFESVANQILDDIELARALLKTGAKGTVVNGSGIATTHMYSSFSEIRAGYGKSLWRAFGGPLGSIVAVFFLFSTGIAPLLLALTARPIGWIIFFMITFTRIISALVTRGRVSAALLHWLSSAILIYLIAYSWKSRGKVLWKGRTV